MTPHALGTQKNKRPWWQTALFYQLYPRSFADGNGDGIGDFLGMTRKLDYLQQLGIDAIWLSPHYPSPFLDCGYDISDYCAVGEEYGTMEDFKHFLAEAHKRNIKVVLDLVLNHSSDAHPWFMQSRQSKDNPKSDWYVWQDPKEGQAPNNWASIFGGSAWQYEPQRGQYYYHAFLKEQPDLNWRNPEVKEAMWNVARFWLDMGVDGFRLDALATIYEHPDFPNHSADILAEDVLDANAFHKDTYMELLRHQVKQDGLHDLMKELRQLLDSYEGDRVLLGEDEDIAFHGTGDDELQLLFNFPLMQTAKLSPEHIRRNQATRLAALPQGAWPCNTLGHHDVSRLRSHYGDGMHDEALARLHMTLLLTLKGTAFLYNGDEIAMSDLKLTHLVQVRDAAALKQYELLTTTLGVAPEEALERILATTRDCCRSPMQWQNTANAGFCPEDVSPWLPVNENYATGINVATQEATEGSFLNFMKTLIALRKAKPALHAGDYKVLGEHEQTLSFLREDAYSKECCLVELNFSAQVQARTIEAENLKGSRVLFSTHNLLPDSPSSLSQSLLEGGGLEPFEARITELVSL